MIKLNTLNKKYRTERLRVGSANLQAQCDSMIKKEKQDATFFIKDFVQIFGIEVEEGIFEYPIHFKNGSYGYADYVIRELLLIEMKSPGADPRKGITQLAKYWCAFPQEERPPVSILCDFRNVWFMNIDDCTIKYWCRICELPNHYDELEVLFDYASNQKKRKKPAGTGSSQGKSNS